MPIPKPIPAFAPFDELTAVDAKLVLRFSIVDGTAVEPASDGLRSGVPTFGRGTPPAFDETGEATFDEFVLFRLPIPPFLDLARSFFPSCSMKALTRIPCTQFQTSWSCTKAASRSVTVAVASVSDEGRDEADEATRRRMWVERWVRIRST